MRILVLAAMSVGTVFGCDCSDPSVKDATDRAEVVFRGTIVALRHASKPASEIGGGRDTGNIVVFRVARVWKGRVEAAFEMPGLEEDGSCYGFPMRFLAVGNELLVYAVRFKGKGYSEFVTGICSGTRLTKYADFAALGAGHEPKKSK